MAVSVPDEADMVGAATTETGLTCPACGEVAFPEELYCQNCGAELPVGGAAAGDPAGEGERAGQASGSPGPSSGSPSGSMSGSSGSAGGATSQSTQPVPTDPVAKVCAVCGGTTFEDGYCSTCGAPAVRERDHWLEQPASWVAAVCDRGIRHHRNEDAVALSAHPEPDSRAVLVVCDGVSSSVDPDLASLAAARAARDVLSSEIPSPPSVAGRIRYWTGRLGKAATAANAEAVDVSRHPSDRPGERQTSPPSCTFVAAVVDGPVIIAGWVGDSRAYWLPDAGPAEQMSMDDSWATEQILGGMPRAQAESAPQAHAITRWLGVDTPDFTPKCAATIPDSPGWLLVCSDGLWNYCSAASELGDLVARISATTGSDPARTATELVNWANAQGGMDNITVALARLNPAAAS
jgi:serine/threonine protein phosphatase PrpC/ribosomal protein L37E